MPARFSNWRSLATASITWRCLATGSRAPKITSGRRILATTPWRPARVASGVVSTMRSPRLTPCRANLGRPLAADEAFALGLATSIPDDMDWADEIRIAIEERVSMSPDALTAMEANLRFDGPETLHTRVFGRLTAWQNWIFQRPNAVGEKGALKVYGEAKRRPSTGTGCSANAGRRRMETAEPGRHQTASHRPGDLHPLQHLRSDLPCRRD